MAQKNRLFFAFSCFNLHHLPLTSFHPLVALTAHALPSSCFLLDTLTPVCELSGPPCGRCVKQAEANLLPSFVFVSLLPPAIVASFSLSPTLFNALSPRHWLIIRDCARDAVNCSRRRQN